MGTRRRNLSSAHDLFEQEDLASSPGAGRDREQAVLGIGELVDPRATSVKFGRRSLNAEIGDEEGTSVVSVGESPIVLERDSRGAGGEVAHREITVQGDVRAAAGRASVLIDDEILIGAVDGQVAAVETEGDAPSDTTVDLVHSAALGIKDDSPVSPGIC